LGGRGRWISEFKASLVYKVSSKTARATEKPCLEKPKTKNQKPKKKKKEKKRKEKKYCQDISISKQYFIALSPDVLLCISPINKITRVVSAKHVSSSRPDPVSK
jgi:hypothetical protein